MKPLTAALASAAGAGAAFGTMYGSPGGLAAEGVWQLAAASFATLCAGVAWALPAHRRVALVPLLASLLGVLAGVAIFAANARGEWIGGLLVAVLGAVGCAVSGGGVMTGILLMRGPMERDPWVRSVVVTGAWTMAVIVSLLLAAPSAPLAIGAGLGLVSIALASRRHIALVRARAPRAATAFRDGPTDPAPNVAPYKAAMIVPLVLLVPLFVASALQTRTVLAVQAIRALPLCEGLLATGLGDTSVRTATSRWERPREMHVYVVGANDKPVENLDAMAAKLRPPTCRWIEDIEQPHVIVKNVDVRPVDIRLDYVLETEADASPRTRELIEARIRENVIKSFQAGELDARSLDNPCWREDGIARLSELPTARLVAQPVVALRNGAAECFANQTTPVWPTLGKLEVSVRPPTPVLGLPR